MDILHEGGMKERIVESSMEVNSVNYEQQFARIMAAEIAGALQVNYGDRDIVVKLLTTTLEKSLDKRGGLLEQYLHTQLDKIANTFKRRLDLPEDTKVNYEYATHAKFEGIIMAIQNKYMPDYGGNI